MNSLRRLGTTTIALLLAASLTAACGGSGGPPGSPPANSPGDGAGSADPGATKGDPDDPCTLLSEQEIADVLGSPVRLIGKLDLVVIPNCEWEPDRPDVDVVVVTVYNVGGRVPFDGAKADDDQPLSGVGDEAFRNARTGPWALVLVGSVSFSVLLLEECGTLDDAGCQALRQELAEDAGELARVIAPRI